MPAKHFNDNVFTRDIFPIVFGKGLGSGIGREVYVYKPNPEYVIKVEDEGFQNIREWETWNEVKHMDSHKHNFAPCEYISNCGIYLIQKRTQRPIKEDYPEMIPHYFFDTKFDNYGVIVDGKKRRFVCHDYGTFSLCNGMTKRKKKADWWG